VYQSASAGLRDFNSELYVFISLMRNAQKPIFNKRLSIDPITKRLATGWERAFQNRLPKAFDTYTKDASKVLHKFHETIEERARENGVGLANLAMLQRLHLHIRANVPRHEASVRGSNERSATRSFTSFVPTIAALMTTAYQLCTDERGPGSYVRMKAHMTGLVDRARHTMFTASTKAVESHLNQMCKAIDEQMSNGADEIVARMRADYMHVLGGVKVSTETTSKEEKRMKAEIKVALNEVDAKFETIVKGEPDEELEDNEMEGDAMKDDEMEGDATKDDEMEGDAMRCDAMRCDER
jgi:hypothetical protein